MPQTLSWQKQEDGIFNNMWFSSVQLMHFRIQSKEVHVITEIN